MRIILKQDTITPALKRFEAHLETSKLSRAIANIALAGVERNFVAQGRTQSGSPGSWPGLAESTKLHRRKHGGGAQILRDTGDLMNSIHPEFEENKITIATGSQPYAAIHQFGGMAGRNCLVRIPKRAYLMLPDPVIDEIKDAVLQIK